MNVKQWLNDMGLGRYARCFADNDIDGEALRDLTSADLKELGVSSLGHRKKILAAIAACRHTDPSEQTMRVPMITAQAGERRQATIIFSDLSNYTAMSERLDPEDVEAVLSRIKAASVRVIERHEGTVNQFVGDEVVALFGIPHAHEDDPSRAVKAALELHAMVFRMSAEVETSIGWPLTLHTAINTGLIVTTLRDDRDGLFSLTGDTVNTGARLLAQAKAGEILVSPETQRLVAPYFETEALEPVHMKGKAELMVPYRVVRKSEIHSRFEAAKQRGFTAFTGRDQELNALHSCMQKTIQGAGQFVTVTGEAGLGKSRLLYEFRHSLDRERVTVLQGRCQS